MKLYLRTTLILISMVIIGASANHYLLNRDENTNYISRQAQDKQNLESKGVIYRFNKDQKKTTLAESELSCAIRKALALNPRTSVLNLNISTVGSRVTISGKAEGVNQIESAIKTVLDIPGVSEVISTVVVDPDIQIAGKDSLL